MMDLLLAVLLALRLWLSVDAPPPTSDVPIAPFLEDWDEDGDDLQP